MGKICDLKACKKCKSISLSATINSTSTTTSITAYLANVHDVMTTFSWNGFTLTPVAGSDTSATFTGSTFPICGTYKMKQDLTSFRSTFVYSANGTLYTGYLSFNSSGYAVFYFPTISSGNSLQLYGGSTSWVSD
jgi:hypothetical protein